MVKFSKNVAYFNYGNYVYFDDFDENPKYHHESFISEKWPNTNIITPNRLICKSLMIMSRMCVGDMIGQNTRIVYGTRVLYE